MRSSHYTWCIERTDGKPIQVDELHYLHLMCALDSGRDPKVTMRLSTLRLLLTADKAQVDAFVSALNGSGDGQDVYVDDAELASGLVELGLVDPAGSNNKYVLMDIEVR